MTNEYLLEKAALVYRKYKECKEIQTKITINTVLSVIMSVLWYIIWIFSAINYFSKPWSTFNPKNILMYIASFTIIAAPFFLFKPHRWLRFKPFVGKITYRKDKSVRVDRVSVQHRLVLKASAINGHKNFKIELRFLPGMLSYYQQNRYIVNFRGVRYPVKFELTDEERNSEQVLCHMCGHNSPRRYKRCFNCRSPLWSKDII